MMPLQEYWAKSPTPGETQGQSLAEHTWRVVEELGRLFRVHPGIGKFAGNTRLDEAAYWAAVFHDLGKVSPGFQNQVRGSGTWGERHEVLSLGFLPWAIPPDDPLWPPVASAVAFHHRDREHILDRYLGDESHWEPLTRGLHSIDLYSIFEWLSVVSREWKEKIGFAFPHRPLRFTPDNPASLVAAARTALVRLDRLPASIPVKLGLLIRGLITTSDHAGSAGAEPPKVLEPSVAEQLARYRRVHQERASTVRGPILLTAPTGSGKTEAGLRWALSQSPSRIYYVLPYQASLNAMYRRLERIFPSAVALQHSRSLLALYRHYLEAEPTPQDAERRARAQQALTRLNRYPVRVLTPYQLLQVAFRLRGFESLLIDLVQAAVIMDEVHAYEPRRLGMFLGLLRWLRRQWETNIGFVSATIPSPLRACICHLFPDIAMTDQPLDEPYRALFKEFLRHELRVCRGELFDYFDEIRSLSQQGSVLIVANTVGRAQEVYHGLRSMGLRPALLHGRLTLRDRIYREQSLTSGDGTTVAQPGSILVATQVVEVSLDIDFDTLFTEPAPLEALVQRFGRVNRSRRHRLARVHVVDSPSNGEGVYSREIVDSSLRVLKNVNGSPLDEASVGDLLGQVYTDSVLSEWQDELDGGMRAIESVLEGMKPFESAPLDLEERFYSLFDGVEVLPASFEQEYRLASASEPLTASELLVPLSYRQYLRLLRSGKVRKERWPPVVDAPYDPELGLVLPEQ